jgi:ABC-type phosphate transport system substrate-binding protein
VRVQVGTQVVKVVSQEPGAIGITQLSIVRKSGAVQLETERAVEQVLSLVTFGEPSDEARRFIHAMQRAAQEGS